MRNQKLQKPDYKLGEQRYEVEWCYHCPVEDGDAQLDDAKYRRRFISDKAEAIAFAKTVLPQDVVRLCSAKFQQDPRSPRKSAADLFKAAVISLTPLASLGKKAWDYLDKRRVVVQRNAVTRSRPAFSEGWRVTFILMINLPEYVSPQLLNETIQQAGRLVGLGDFRPSYGRFQVVEFKVVDFC